MVEALGDSPRAMRAIWPLLLDVDLVPRVRAGQLPIDTPLAAALRVQEARPGALGRADALFHCPVAPWCPGIF